MARIRSVYPSLWTDEAYLELTIKAKLFVIALWSECDDGGAFEWKPKQLRVRLFGCDDMDVAALLTELQDANFLKRYEVDGAAYGAVRAFGKFQNPRRPSRVHPMPDQIRLYAKTEKLKASDEPVESGPVEVRPDADRDCIAVSAVGTGSPNGGADADDDDADPADDATIPDNVGRGPGDGGTCSGHVTPGEERRGEEKEGGKKTLPSVAAPHRAAAVGTFLPRDWEPTPEDRAFAVGLGLDPDTIADRFRDYWWAKPGKEGRKSDWPATWRNWCRDDRDRGRSRNPQGGRRRAGSGEDGWGAMERHLGITTGAAA